MSLTITTSVQQQQQQHLKKPTMPTTTEPDEAVVHPDSTTPLDKERPAFGHGQDVLLKHKDGRYYLGTVVEVDMIREQCLVKFGDNTESWSSFKDLTKLSVPDEDLLCVVCKKSGDKFEVKVCDKCGRGYHMKCHQPEIPAECQKEGATWMCKKCVDCFQGRNKVTNDKGVLKKENIRKVCSGIESSITPPTDRSKLPYNPDLLNWDTYHRVNIEQIYCYCGRNGEWYTQMLQCGRCRQWFHEKCVRCLKYPLYCGDRFYVFVCSICNNGREFVRRLELKWVDMVHLMLFNLTSFNTKKYYDLDTVIIPYVNDNWHALQLPPKIYGVTKQERRENILSVLTNNRNRFKCGREIKKRTTIWGLRVRLPPPAPCVTLPSTGTITEEGLRERWEGNRRLQFLSVPPEDEHTDSGPPLPIETVLIKQEIKQEIEDDDDEDVKLIPNELTMLGIMRGTRYQNNQTFSETESPCSSPIPSAQQLEDHDDDDEDDDDHDDHDFDQDEDDDDEEDDDDDEEDDDIDDNEDDGDEDYDDKSITETNLKLYKMDYHGGGFVKKSVPFPKISKQRRKHLLSLNKRGRDKMLRRQKQKQRKLGGKSERQQAKGGKDTRLRKTRRLNLKPVLADKELKKQEESNLPLTPPTSVSAPPTPPASSTPLQSALSNEITSDYSLNSVDLAQNLNNLNKSTKPSLKSELNSLELNTPCSSGDETSSKSTLDLIIPPPKDFEGKNNPFHALLKGAAPAQKATNKTSITLPLPLTAVIPSAPPVARPTKRQLSEKDICIGPNGEVKRRRLRRNRAQSQQISSYNPGQPTASKTAAVVPARPDGKEWTQRALRSSFQNQNQNNSGSGSGASQQSQNQNQQTQIGNCVDYALNGRRLRQRQDAAAVATSKNSNNNNNAQDSAVTKGGIMLNSKSQTAVTKTSPIKQEPDINMDDLKSSVNIYFGAANRIASGERFGVKAKRIGPCGKIQYLIEWEGPSQGMT